MLYILKISRLGMANYWWIVQSFMRCHEDKQLLVATSSTVPIRAVVIPMIHLCPGAINHIDHDGKLRRK